MTTHLKSRNASWKLKKTKRFDIKFSNPVGCIYENEDGIGLLYKNKKRLIKKKSFVKALDDILKKGHYLCGYFSFEFLETKIKKPHYKAIFNIYDKKTLGKKVPSTSASNKRTTLDKIQSDEKFVSGVARARRYIQEGDIYQINLTREFSFSTPNNPYRLFTQYYLQQPVDYASYLEFPDHTIISGSMELFMEKFSNKIRTKPIKGTSSSTRKDGGNINYDKKELAENLMIVDLMRNDLSRVCKTGSVVSKKLFRKKRYSTLYQLESEIEGTLKSSVSNEKIFTSVMPPGSVTGAPKSRALEIIKKIEKHYRGPYCGAIGIFEPNGDFCFSVGIRISKIEKKNSKFFAGAGIVWDSNPKKENSETILKARAFKAALRKQ
jgi:anthranilate/para-aminobenzoate synthase component I